MKQTPYQLRRMYRLGLLEINTAASLVPPEGIGKTRVQTWIRVIRRAIRYLQTNTNSEQMAKILKGVNSNTVTPQAIRQEIAKGFAILLARGYLREVTTAHYYPSKTPPAGRWPAHN